MAPNKPTPSVAKAPTVLDLPCSCFQARKLARLTTALFDQCLSPAGITIAQFSILMHLDEMGSPTINQLAERLFTDRTTISRNIKLMASAGWVQEHKGQNKRQKPWALTKAGLKKLKEAKPLWKKAQTTIEVTLGTPETQALNLTLYQACQDLLPHIQPLTQ